MTRILATVLALGVAGTAVAQSDGGVVYGDDRVQAYIGVMEIDDETGELQNDTGEPVDIDFANLLALGIEVETPFRSRDKGLEIGVNAGGGFSWKGDDTEFAGKIDEDGGTAVFKIDNEMWILEAHIGGYIRGHIGKSADFYFGAGPAIIFAQHDVDDDDIDDDAMPSPTDATIILGDDSSSDIILGYYARTGIEFDLGAGRQWGIGIRYLGGELDFDDTVGEFDLKGFQALITYSAWY